MGSNFGRLKVVVGERERRGKESRLDQVLSTTNELHRFFAVVAAAENIAR